MKYWYFKFQDGHRGTERIVATIQILAPSEAGARACLDVLTAVTSPDDYKLIASGPEPKGAFSEVLDVY